jgi:hypothetical protein
MGFYLRKSVKFGGVRLNLSKSGIGMSAGVKGFRVGVDSRGRTYVAGGKGGLYYREYLAAERSGELPADAPPDDKLSKRIVKEYVALAIGLAVCIATLGTVAEPQRDHYQPVVTPVALPDGLLSGPCSNPDLKVSKAQLQRDGSVLITFENGDRRSIMWGFGKSRYKFTPRTFREQNQKYPWKAQSCASIDMIEGLPVDSATRGR